MRHLLTALLVSCVVVSAADVAAPRDNAAVSKCFKVRRLLKTDSTHYWADWTNTCAYTIDAVYVMVGFLDSHRQEMGKGVWPMYFVNPGVHRVTRFSAPVADFETVHVHRITTDSVLALSAERVEPVRPPTPAGIVADPGIGRIIFSPPQIAANQTKY
jgi:hypothetical protein